MNFGTIFIRAPPEVFHHGFKLVAETHWQPEATHSVCLNLFDNCFEENFLPTNRKQLIIPSMEELPDSFFNYTEQFLFVMARECREAQIGLMTITN